ncbi:YbaB/EbfC family nucleoid-associated protein [Pseudonocardia abyssalis]|uniref:YbaB/EbfC family nucleoid-associated protein n=1 Tax=Pseudonocardia abyssalis TaxID=2792008 RepID=A0ABS6V212_9PSEU|nr:YbaB/EbfC family nucleoid-associated protein [Pseudonocardia abyssalis]MBW0114152.1 YbaB/EbfC family nucleoid-associated protein [Pseudonocardia abyssalis]MBW0138545.1 YbaB/EbfC family nucleoid-associated protein [Pseudonocardia abyssalis]
MDGRQWLDSYQHRLTDLKARADRAQAALAGVDGTAASPDGAVSVTVAPGGAVRRIVFSERSEALSRVQLAALVVETAARAQAEADRRVTEAVAPLLGGDSEAMQVIRSYQGSGS